MRPSRSEFVPIRGLRHHIRRWGPPDSEPLVLCHGWMDCSASFQFLVDFLPEDWSIAAPDWRGFGLSEWQNGPYWFPDYLADLDVLLDHLSPSGPARLLGHSMGGNIVCLYSGIRPERVGALMSIEGFGLPGVAATEAPARYGKWLKQAREGPRAKSYASTDALAERLARDNRRLMPERAKFLAENFSLPAPGGGVRVAGDPWHKIVYPVLYRLEEAMACWRKISAPALWILGRDSDLFKAFEGRTADLEERKRCFSRLQVEALDECGHMVQHDQPERLAELLVTFLAGR